MRKEKMMVLVLTTLLVTPLMGRAETLAEKEKKAPQNKSLAENLQSTNESCGTAITASIDWASITPADLDQYGPAGYCDEAMAAIRGLCGTDDGKAAVKGKIKKLVCTVGGAGKRAVALKDGTLRYTIDWKASNNTDFVNDYLKNNI